MRSSIQGTIDLPTEAPALVLLAAEREAGRPRSQTEEAIRDAAACTRGDRAVENRGHDVTERPF